MADEYDINADPNEGAEEDARLAQFAEAIRKEDLRWIMSDRRGRRWMWVHLQSLRLFEISFTGNSQTFFNEGTRNAGLKLYTEITELDPKSFTLMMNENSNLNEEDNNATD